MEALLARSIERLCTTLGFEVGHAYVVEDATLRSAAWHLADPHFERFRAVSEEAGNAQRGIAPHVLISREPEWLDDLPSGTIFLRGRAAEVTGLRSGCCLPVTVDGDPVAVLELFRTARSPIAEALRGCLLDAVGEIAAEIARARRETDVCHGAALWHSLFAGPQAIAVLGADLAIVAANASLAELLGTSVEKLTRTSLPDLGCTGDDTALLRDLTQVARAEVGTKELACALRREGTGAVGVAMRVWPVADDGERHRLLCLVSPAASVPAKGPERLVEQSRAALRDLTRITDIERLIPAAIAIGVRLSGEYAGMALARPEARAQPSYHHTAPEGYTVELAPQRVASIAVLQALPQEDRPIRLAQARGHPALISFPPGQRPLESFLGVPLRAAGQTLGHLLLGRRTGKAFSAEEEVVAMEIAAALAQVVRRLRMEARNEVLRSRALRLVRANLALLAQVRPGGVAQWAVNDLRTLVDAEYAALLLRHPPGGGEARFFHAGLAGGGAAAVAGGPPQARGLLGAAMLGGRPMRLTDLRNHPTHTGFTEGHPVMTSFLSAPVVQQGTPIGLLFATNKRDAPGFSDADESFIATLADELGRSRALGREPEPADPIDRIATSSRSLRREMEATRAFLGALSHELRGSISGIMMSAELLCDPSLAELKPEQARRLGARILSVSTNLLALVDNLLDLGRLEAGRLDVRLQPVSLHTILNDVQELVSPLADRAGVAVDWPSPASTARVVADPVRLRQVLVNLCTNAVKFTEPGGHVWLEVAATGGSVTMAVCDTGRGIATEDQERIFEPFVRAEEGVEAVPGSGLGLAISRRIIALHSGTLEVTSAPGLGSRFSFSLRRSREPLPPRLVPPRRAEPEVLDPDGEHVPELLLVEDDPVNRQSMTDVLRSAGYAVRAVETRTAALQSAGNHSPDLAILDVQLPDGDGLGIVDTLHAAGTAVIAVSADRVGDAELRAARAGCDRFALKPVPARDLLGMVAAVLGDRLLTSAAPVGGRTR